MMSVWTIAPVVLILAALPTAAQTESPADSGEASRAVIATTPARPYLIYTRPTPATKFHNYLFDGFGPVPIAGSALAAGIGQMTNSPPAWGQGAEGYGKRFGSSLGIAAVSTTTRYALAAAFKQDTIYYRCECKGALPRLRHAVISSLTARHGEDGRRVFSVPALVAPYAGTMTAVYAWYPGRYGAEDAFRMGNYALLATIAGNIAREFLFNGRHSLLSFMHLDSGRATPNPGSNP